MNRQLAVRNVVRSLARFKARAVLAGFGIVVSVLATVFVLSMGGSVRSTFDSFVGRMYPADVISVIAGSSFWAGGSGVQTMRLRDVAAVERSVSDIVAWDVVLWGGRRDVRGGERVTRVGVRGAGANMPEVRRRPISEGAAFEAADIETRARVALIGQTTARALFGDESPVGATLFIENTPYKVKGMLSVLGVSPHGDDEDDVLYLPYTVVMDNLNKVDYIPQVAFQVSDASRMEEVGRQIAAVLREQHGITEGRPDDFSIIVPKDIQERIAGTFRTINIFVALICAAAFLISALVVLGVMHVTVRQRVPELGLRKAVGADAAAVRSQIVWEALVIAAVACVAGALLAWVTVYFTAPVLARKFGVEGAQMTALAVLVGAAAAFVTGLLGAWLPARRASRLDPVEALRMR
jgi:ABC-type antimicrobial peptide transport system permease subunit